MGSFAWSGNFVFIIVCWWETLLWNANLSGRNGSLDWEDFCLFSVIFTNRDKVREFC